MEIERYVQEILRWLIAHQNLTEKEVASALGVSQSYINKLKNGKICLRSLKTVFHLLENYQDPYLSFKNERNQEDNVCPLPTSARR